MACFVNLKGCNVSFKLVIFSGDELSCISSNKLIKKISIKQKIQKEVLRTTLLQQLSEHSIGISSSSSSSSRVWKRGSTKSGPMATSNQPTSGNFFLFFYLFYFFTLSHCLGASSNSFLSISPLPFFFFFPLLFSLGLFVSSNSLLSTFFFPFTLYPSLLDPDCLQQFSPLCIFSTFFFLTLLSWTLTISSNSSFSIFPLFFFPLPFSLRL